MTPVERDIVRRKLAVITESLSALEPIARMDVEQFVRDLYMRKAAERLLQELIEAAIDINTHLIVDRGARLQTITMKAISRQGNRRPIPGPLPPAGSLAGLRNRLVHEYDVIDRSLVFESLKRALALYPRYVESIDRFLT